WDLVLATVSPAVPWGLEAVRALRERDPRLPVIALLEPDLSEMGAAAKREGVHGCVSRGDLQQLTALVEGALEHRRRPRPKPSAEAARRAEARRYRALFESAAVSLLEVDLSG